jgi:hypothetical protein
MAAKRKKKRSSRRRKKGVGFGQKLVVALSFAVLVLCAASATWSFFVRHGGDPDERRPFSIEVLNGTGRAGLADEAKKGLLHLGIDVIEVGNAEHFNYGESVLIARKRGADVEKLGVKIGCRNVVVQIDEDAIEDATLILGADYRRLILEWDDD